MRLLILIAIIFYVFIISLVGFTGLLFLAHFIDLRTYLDFMTFIYKDPQANTLAGVIVAITMLISLIYARIIYGRQERERNIFINNPLGRVTISVSALEDLVRRMAVRSPQVKEIYPYVTSAKKGLHIDIRLVLRSAANIPELTADLQNSIKARIQGVIGADERVNIRIHVVKITSDSNKSGKGGLREYEEDDTADLSVPFPGYKA
ncbi:MAG: alkaline shock response membrane anchor protein AmaP [Candidatus Omnitrophica bacterium]|nr:alkaline shock response membrane anchor protein AmaP [Candidatus Omnitrophota bacterium]